MRIQPGTISATLGMAGVGVFAVTPAWIAPYLGWTFIAAAVGVLIGGVELENGHLAALPLRRIVPRSKRMWPQLLMLISLVGFAVGVVAYWQGWATKHTQIARSPEALSVSTAPVPVQATQPTLFDWFMHDLHPQQGMTWNATTDFELKSGDKEFKIRVFYNIYDDFNSNAKFLAFYIPAIFVRNAEPPPEQTLSILKNIAADYPRFISDIQKDRWAVMGSAGSANISSTRDTPFSGRIYVYHADELSIEQMAELQKLFRDHGAASVEFRGISYALSAWTSIRLGALKAPPHFEVRDGVAHRVIN